MYVKSSAFNEIPLVISACRDVYAHKYTYLCKHDYINKDTYACIPRPIIKLNLFYEPPLTFFSMHIIQKADFLKINKQLHIMHAKVARLERSKYITRRILKFLEHLQVKGDCESDAGTRYSWESQSSVWLWGNMRRVGGWKPLSWAHSRHQKASKRGKKKAAHRQPDEKLLAPLQLRNEFSVIWRCIVMEMKRNLDLRVNLLSHAEMGR